MSNEHRSPSTTTPCEAGRRPINLLIALAYGPPDADGNYEVSEEEIREAEEIATRGFPPELQAVCDSITPESVWRTIQESLSEKS